MAKGKKTGGRQKGTPNRLSMSVKNAVLETFANLGGVEHMTGWAEENPSEFYRIAARLIPQQLTADITHKVNADELPDSVLAHIATAGSNRDAEEKDCEEKSSSVH